MTTNQGNILKEECATTVDSILVYDVTNTSVNPISGGVFV